MTLMQHINRFEVRWSNNENCLQSIESVLCNLQHIVGKETDTDLGSSGLLTSESGGDGGDGSVGEEVNEDGGATTQESMRLLTPTLRERGLIEQMEEEAVEAGLGGWFNGEDQSGLPESWSGSNSRVLSSQDWVWMTELTMIGGRTLPSVVSGPLCFPVCSLQTVHYLTGNMLYLCLKPRAASFICYPLGLTLG